MSFYGSNYFGSDYYASNYFGPSAEEAAAASGVSGHFIFTESDLLKIKQGLKRTFPKEVLEEMGGEAVKKVVKTISKLEKEKAKKASSLPNVDLIKSDIEGLDKKQARLRILEVEREIARLKELEREQQEILRLSNICDLVCSSIAEVYPLESEIHKLRQDLMDLDDEELFVMLVQ